MSGRMSCRLQAVRQHEEACIQMPPVEVGDVLGLLMDERGGGEDEKGYSIT